MIAPLIWNGLLHLVSIRKTAKGNVARVYDVRKTTPEAIFPEIAPNCYEDQITGNLFKVLDGKMVAF